MLSETQTKPTIKRAASADATYLSLLMRVTFEQAFGHVWTDKPVLKNYLDTIFAVDKIAGSIQKPNNVFFIAYVNKLPVGYAKLKLHSPYEKLEDKDAAQLQKIYVLHDYIGLRIGEQLQQHVFDCMLQEGKSTLWLAVWDGNDKAIRFYEKHGYHVATTYQYKFQNTSFNYDVMVKKFSI